jgi:5-methyltetrahydrofolate--homocysteine methyltransferase
MAEITVERNDVAVVIGPTRPTVVIGERINPTGKDWLKQALQAEDWDVVAKLARDQVDAGARIIDVNVAMPGVREVDVLPRAVEVVQRAVETPLCLDSDNAEALAAALSVCDGTVIINSVTGNEDKLDAILPLARDCGAAIIGLPMDRDSGIPKTAEARLEIAARIRDAVEAAGINPDKLIVDCLTLAVSADESMGLVALETMRRVSTELGLNINMGVSNVSFGLPERPLLNSTFIAMACAAGLTCAIVNPSSTPVMSALLAADVLLGRDRHARAFLRDYRSRRAEIGSGA